MFARHPRQCSDIRSGPEVHSNILPHDSCESPTADQRPRACKAIHRRLAGRRFAVRELQQRNGWDHSAGIATQRQGPKQVTLLRQACVTRKVRITPLVMSFRFSVFRPGHAPGTRYQPHGKGRTWENPLPTSPWVGDPLLLGRDFSGNSGASASSPIETSGGYRLSNLGAR
jgi:hypothetical protein